MARVPNLSVQSVSVRKSESRLLGVHKGSADLMQQALLLEDSTQQPYSFSEDYVSLSAHVPDESMDYHIGAHVVTSGGDFRTIASMKPTSEAPTEVLIQPVESSAVTVATTGTDDYYLEEDEEVSDKSLLDYTPSPTDSEDSDQKKYCCDSGRRVKCLWFECRCRCLCRDCAFFSLGTVLSVLLCVIGFVVFVLVTNNTHHQNRADVPSTVAIQNSSSASDLVKLHWTKSKQHGSAIDYYMLQFAVTDDSSDDTDNNYVVKKEKENSVVVNNGVGDEGVETRYVWVNYTLNDDGLYGKATVKHLRGDTLYGFRVRAHNGIGFGNWSNVWRTATEKATVPLPPLFPFGIEAIQDKTDVDSSKVKFTIAWTIQSDGGSQITAFRVEKMPISSSDDNDTSTRLVVKSNANSQHFANDLRSDYSDSTPFCQVSNVALYDTLETTLLHNCSADLEVDEMVQFVVFAENAIGSSEASEKTPCIVPSANVDFYMCLPSKPPDSIEERDVSFQVSAYAIDMQWQVPNSQYYIFRYDLQRDDWWNETQLFNVKNGIPNDGLDLYAKMNGLLPGIPYHIRVRAVNQFGAADWSELFAVTTPEMGECGNYRDLSQMHTHCDGIDMGMIQIYFQCSAKNNPDQCQKDAMQDKYGFSSNCAGCFVDFNDCVMGHCFKQCMGDPQKCQECFERVCNPATLECTGFPTWPLWCTFDESAL